MSLLKMLQSKNSHCFDDEFQVIDEIGHDLEQFLCRCSTKEKTVSMPMNLRKNVINYYEDEQSLVEYIDIFGKRERIAREVAFIELVTEGKIKSVLDLGCGVPYHLMELRKRGTQLAVGVDNSKMVHKMSEKILKNSEKQIAKSEFDFRLADMRKLTEDFKAQPVKAENGFDVVMAMNGTAQLSDNDEDNLAVLSEIKNNLSPSGSGILVFANRDDVIRNIKQDIWSLNNNIIELVSIEYDPITMVCKQDIMRFNLVKPEAVDIVSCLDKLYTYQDVQRMVEKAELKVETVFGDFDMSTLSYQSPWMIFVVKN